MIKLSNINIRYDKVLLENSNITFYNSGFHLIKGASGKGKSTLLYRVGLISEDSDYLYYINDTSITKMNQMDKSFIRKYSIGYVLQDSSLFEQYDVLGNLKLYSSFVGEEYSEEKYIQILKLVSLFVPLNQTIESLSGGEKQRLAIACALCKNTDIIILDEPTNSLDGENEKKIFSLLQEIAHSQNKCIIVASHSYYASFYADYVYAIDNQRIDLLKDSAIKNKVYLKKRIKKHLNIKFYIGYIKYFMKKYKLLNILMMIALISAFLISLLSYAFNDYYLDKSKNKILDICENQLFITNDVDDIYADDLKSVFLNSKLKEINKIDENVEIYPYIPIKANVSGIDVKVFPYFDKNKMDRNELCKLDINAKNGIYLSNSVYSSLASKQYDLSFISIYYEIGIYENSHLKYISYEQESKVKSALKKGVYSAYQPNCENYIYVNYQQLSDMYSKISNSNDYLGYTLFTDNFDSFKKIEDYLQSIDVGTNSTFMNLESLNELVNYSNIIKVISQIIILAIFSLVISVMHINYLKKRAREFALLMINGVSRQDLLKLIYYEILLKLIPLFLLSILVVVIPNYFLKFTMISVIGMGMVDLLIMLVLILIISNYYIRKLVPEQVLRN